MTAQSVILPLPSDHARFIVLRLKDLSIDELKNNSKRCLKHATVSLLSIQTRKLKQQSLLVQNFGSNFTVNLLLALNNLNQKTARSTCQPFPLMSSSILLVCVLIFVLH